MPIYDLKCNKCQTEFEFIKIKTTDVRHCPICNESIDIEILPPKKTSHILKGRGWAKDGYSSGKK